MFLKRQLKSNTKNRNSTFNFFDIIVSNQGLEGTLDYKGTGVYVYAKKVREVTSNLSIDEISKQYEQRKAELDIQMEKLSETKDNKALNSKILLLKEDVEFLRRSLTIIKDIKG